jgi:hypothetical protein
MFLQNQRLLPVSISSVEIASLGSLKRVSKSFQMSKLKR